MTSQPFRFSIDQIKLSTTMKSLINLYYYFKCPEEKAGKITKAVVRDKIAGILEEFYESRCSYDRKNKKFLVAKRDNKDSKTKTIRLINFSDPDLGRFMITMELLRNEILAERHAHFALFRVDDHVSSYVFIKRDAFEKQNILHDPNLGEEEIVYKASQKEQGRTVSLIGKNIVTLTDESISYAEVEDDEIRVQSSRDRIYEVEVLSDFGKRAAGARYVQDNGKHKITRVDHFESLRISSFLLLLRAILIHFHIHFDGYHRLKICKYSGCKRLFFEKKIGSKEFCNGTCRKRHLDSSDNDGKRRCRARQNAWLVRSKKSKGNYTVNRSHCVVCLAPAPTGKCSKLLELNARYLG